MAAQRASQTNEEGSWYEICLEGRLHERWAERFERLSIQQQGGRTILSGPITDQAALHGLLRQVRDLGLPLLLVRRLEPEHREAAEPITEGGERTKAPFLESSS